MGEGLSRGIGGVQAVLFDCGATLIEPDPPVDVQFVRVAAQRGHNVPLEQVHPYMEVIDRYYDMLYMKDSSFWASQERSVDMWYDIYRFLSHLTGLADDAEGMARDLFAAYLKPDSWKVYGDVVPTLQRLKDAGCRLAVVSNWDPSLPGLLDGLGLVGFFDALEVSALAGARKPEPQIFERALRDLGVAANACVHVGDKVDADGDGAASAGIRAVIIDRAGQLAASQAACPYPVIGTLAALPAVLERSVRPDAGTADRE